MVAARAKAARPRVHQPAGYNRTVAGYVDARMHRCKHHDYVYYPASWYDENNNHWKAGYYDEDGNYYSNVAFLVYYRRYDYEYDGNHYLS